MNCCTCVISCSEIKSLFLVSTPSCKWLLHSFVFSSTTCPFWSYVWFTLYFFFPKSILYSLYPCPRFLYFSDRIYLFLTPDTNLFKTLQVFFKAISCVTSSFGLLLKKSLLPSFTSVVCLLLLSFTALYTLSHGWYCNHICPYFSCIIFFWPLVLFWLAFMESLRLWGHYYIYDISNSSSNT